MLNLIKSNRMEDLLDTLCQILEKVPNDPMAPEWIGIQSRGMKQWLTVSIAGRLSICANMAFLFPRQILERLGLPEQGFVPREVMTWAVLDRLLAQESWPPSMARGPGRYLLGDATGKKAWQLSRRIADIFDDYQVYRSGLLDQWARGQKEGLGPDEDWQAWLWPRMVKDLDPPWPGSAGPLPGGKPPSRIFLFGISAMPPAFLEAFFRLSKSFEVYLFLLTPTDQFFFDLFSVRQTQKDLVQGRGDEAALEEGSLLLRALGKSGREFHGILEHFDYHEPFGQAFQDPAALGPPSMLAVLQSDILNLTRRGPQGTAPPVAVDPGDTSVSLHACHSPMREAQVLKDQILAAMAADPDLAPHEIIVMMPDIEAYAPFLEAVFSQAPRLPYTVSDRRRRSESQTVEAFLKILAQRSGRLEKSQVMDLLQYPAIAERFELASEDVETLNRLLSRARVLWGWDENHRQATSGMPYFETTWQFGLQRLLFGTALPEGEQALSGSVLPCDGFEGLEAQVLGRFAHFCATLFQGLLSLEAEKTLTEWVQSLQQLILTLMTPEEGQGDTTFLLAALDALGREGEVARFSRRIGFSMVEEALTAKLDQSISQGSFMAGSITLCNLMPMRSIPFKMVCLMGMDEKSFPRQARPPGFDLISRFPRLGDKQVREEDCYLFLESLLSARKRFLITYTGMGISDNCPIPCAGPVAELKDAVSESFDFPQGFFWEQSHPLHPFSPVYFDPGVRPELFSYSASLCRIAQALRERTAVKEQPVSAKAEPSLASGSAPKAEAGQAQDRLSGRVLLEDLVRFFRSPARAWAEKTLGLVFPVPREAALDREAFELSGLDLYQAGEAGLGSLGDQGLFDRLKARGLLPLGQKALAEWDRVTALAAPVAEAAAALFPPERPEEVEIRFQAGPFDCLGLIPDRYPHGRYVKTFARLTPVRILTQWLIHLFYCAGTKTPGPTLVLGRDLTGRKPLAAYRFSPVTQADLEVETLCRLFLRGLETPLPFACTPCFNLVQALSKNDFDLAFAEAALNLARPFWSGSPYLTGEIEDRYTALAFKGTDPFESLATLERTGFLSVALAVVRPLMEHQIP